MADWSQMPKDLLCTIADRFDAKTDVVRCRSVCSTWRQSVAPTRCRLSSCSPIVPNDGFSDPAWGLPLSLSLSKRTLFLIGLPGDQTEPGQSGASWLVKTRDDVPLKLLNPLTRSQFIPLPDNFPRTLDTLQFRVLELGIENVLQYMSFRTMGDPLGVGDNLYMERVAFMCLNCTQFVLLTIHVSGRLAVFESRSKKWSIVSEMPSPYDDVILHKGEFYAVDCVGRTVTVGLDLTLNSIAGPVFGGDKKFLVESIGELMLIDKYLTVDAADGGDTEVIGFDDEPGFIFHERTVRFKVYKLDREELKWIRVRDIGDRVLFIGDDCRFSVMSSDLKACCKGNCILFADDFFSTPREEENDAVSKRCEIGVYDMETGKIGPLEDYRGFSELFWPPPEWITSRTSEV